VDKWFSEKNKQVNRVTACWESHPEPLNEEKTSYTLTKILSWMKWEAGLMR